MEAFRIFFLYPQYLKCYDDMSRLFFTTHFLGILTFAKLTNLFANRQ